MPTHQLVPDSVDALIVRARAADGVPPFSDQSVVELCRGERELVTTTNGAVTVGAAIVGPDELELVIDPGARGKGLGTELLDRVISEHPGAVFAWAHGDHPGSRALANRFAFTQIRTLLQLHAPVPGSAFPKRNSPPATKGGDVRRLTAFTPGTDDAEWLSVNARAFAHHPEQGGLTQQDLDDRIADSWFNSDDFLVLRDGDTMIGFCWLKIVDTSARGIGEFYAVGIDPEHQGEGLGRVLMDAGFARLAEHGIHTANLYVEADNEPALALYRRYGFQQHTIDVQYQRRGR